MWWFTTSEDQHHTFEGILRMFETFGGVPATARTDRMGALGSSQGRRFKLHPATVAFGAHHGVKITSCQAGDAKRKGKVERPFRQLRETFLPEVELAGIPADINEFNRRAQIWLDGRVHAVPSRTTGVPPAERAEVEREFRAPLPRVRFDTDYVDTRRVHPIVPFISVDGGRYSVPPEVLGQLVEIRRAVDTRTFTVRYAGRVVITHELSDDPGHDIVWDPAHRAATEAIALAGRPTATSDRHLRVVPPTAMAEQLELPDGFDVDDPDLDARYGIGADLA
jgi:hypothetical protein